MAANQGNQNTEHDRLGNRQPQIRQLHRLGQRCHEIGGGQTDGQVRCQHAAKQRGNGGPHCDQRHGHGHGNHTRHHQPVALGDAHDAHGIELLGDAHHTNLRRDGRSGPPRNQDRRQHRPQFADQRDAEYVDDKCIRPELAQLLRHQVGQHDADQKAHQRSDGQRRSANVVQVPGDIAPRPFDRMAYQFEQVDDQLPQQAHETGHMPPHTEHPVPQRLHGIQRRTALGPRWRHREAGDALQHGPLHIEQFQPLRPVAAPGIPQDLGTAVVQALQAAQIPTYGRPTGCRLRQCRLQRSPVFWHRQMGSRPDAKRHGTFALGEGFKGDAGLGILHGGQRFLKLMQRMVTRQQAP